MISGGTRFHCPVDRCGWYYDEIDEQAAMEMQSLDSYMRNAVKISNTAGLRDATEQELERHLRTHPLTDFVATISRLRQELAAVRKR